MTLRASDPLPGESLTGFFRRLADLHAYRHVGSFLGRLELRYGRRMIENLPSVASKLGVATPLIEQISPRANPDRPALEWRFQRIYQDPFCPECLAEGRVWQQLWRHSLVVACPVHRIRLQAVCPRCRTSVAPQTGGYHSCECGLALSTFPRDEASDGECVIAELISGESLTDQSIPFAGDTPPDIASFLYFLATSQVEDSTGKSGKTPLPQTIGEATDFVRPAADFLSDWPAAFDGHVHARLTAGSSDANSAPERLGSWYQRAMRFRAPAYEPFRARIGAIITETFEGAYLGALGDHGHRTWVSAAAAAKDLGVRAERLVAEVAGGRIPGHQRHSGLGHRHTQVCGEAIEAIRADRERFLSAKAAAEELGVSKQQFSLLREAGLVTEIAVADRPPLTDGGFDQRALVALAAGIRDSGTDGETSGELVSFREISLRRTTDRSALFTLFRAMRDGEFRPSIAPPRHRLGDFLFDAAKISSFLTTAGGPKPYTALEVARITGWKHECVTHWCKEGLLRSNQGQRGAAEAMLISPQDLAEFQRRFLVVADLARTLSTSPRHLLKRMQEAGIPIEGVKLVGNARRCCLVDQKAIWSIVNSAAI